MKLTWRRIIGIAVAAVLLFFIIRSLKSGLDALGAYRFSVSALRIAAAFAAYGLLFPVYGALWQFIVRKFGYKMSYGASLSAWLLSQAGRYVPGKLWFALGRIYLCEREGVPKSVTTIATGLELMLVLASSIVVFSLTSILRPGVGGHPYMWSVLLVPLIIVGIHPRVLREILSGIRRFRGNKQAADVTAGFELSYLDVLKLLMIYIGCWCLYGVGYYLIASSLSLRAQVAMAPAAPHAKLIPELIGINALSWAVGFVSLITPAGLGVREGISTFLLSGLCDKPYPSLIPLVARVWTTIAEVVAIGLAAATRGKR